MRKILTLILVMGFLSKLFGQAEKKSSESSVNQELKSEYNLMKSISLEESEKHKNTKQYKLIENGIYQDLNDEDDGKYRMTISYELESDESNNQYPLEDVLDKYYLHVSDYLESINDTNSNKYKLELGGDLVDLKKAKEIIGKRIYNSDYLDEGQIRVKLVIE